MLVHPREVLYGYAGACEPTCHDVKVRISDGKLSPHNPRAAELSVLDHAKLIRVGHDGFSRQLSSAAGIVGPPIGAHVVGEGDMQRRRQEGIEGRHRGYIEGIVWDQSMPDANRCNIA